MNHAVKLEFGLDSSMLTVACGCKKLQDTVEPGRLVAERNRHERRYPSALQESRVKRRRTAHREVHAVPEVVRGAAGEVRRWLRQPQRLNCNCELV